METPPGRNRETTRGAPAAASARTERDKQQTTLTDAATLVAAKAGEARDSNEEPEPKREVTTAADASREDPSGTEGAAAAARTKAEGVPLRRAATGKKKSRAG